MTRVMNKLRPTSTPVKSWLYPMLTQWKYLQYRSFRNTAEGNKQERPEQKETEQRNRLHFFWKNK